jgi:hypothetical protein
MKMGVIALKGYLQPPSSEVGCIPNLDKLFGAGVKFEVPILLDINMADDRMLQSLSPHHLLPVRSRFSSEELKISN